MIPYDAACIPDDAASAVAAQLRKGDAARSADDLRFMSVVGGSLHQNAAYTKPLPALAGLLPSNAIDSPDYERVSELLEFDGPLTGNVGGVRYETLTQYGIKVEGAILYPDEETRCWTEAEAWWRFKRVLWAYLVERPAKQLAWRDRPHAKRGPDGDYVVRCRLALLNRDDLGMKAGG